ncbi:conjugative transfer signal peptidase TraF [Sphingopyxis sp. OAS728]|uniref:S26 family signal peptidase n=1 Tax=Sphingopyxis sp. OAS728 TaxID=2663823 RepID=UPI00178AE8F9|nr:S26 family signal peptidase [Sphingopyxis sp. OAS728]MBE1529839.1 conjugative transfer signal peptidase TraF [Sphingopyxis sp. OAS728]
MRRRRLRAALVPGVIFAGLFGAVAALAPQPRLVWNASASMPIGLYGVEVGRRPQAGELALIDPPERVAALLAERGYLPRGVPLLKRVAASDGALVCRSGSFVTVDGRGAARAHARDRSGRPLPRWLGCRRLQRGEYFVLGAAPGSFDSRYFGPLPAAAVIGTAHPLFTRDAPGTPLRWRTGAPHPPSTAYEKEPQ